VEKNKYVPPVPYQKNLITVYYTYKMTMHMFTVPSFTNPDKEYTARYDDKIKKWYCNCPHFLVREKRIKTCKHIGVAKEQLKGKHE
jgi:hypothetical protein